MKKMAGIQLQIQAPKCGQKDEREMWEECSGKPR